MRVLFVCAGNAHRSPLAEALLKKARPDWTADSAGLDVEIPVASQIRSYLAEEGAEQYVKRAPEDIREKKLDTYDLIIAMEERHRIHINSICPQCASKTVVWNVGDPYFMPADQARRVYDKIKEKVQQLAKSQ